MMSGCDVLSPAAGREQVCQEQSHDQSRHQRYPILLHDQTNETRPLYVRLPGVTFQCTHTPSTTCHVHLRWGAISQPYLGSRFPMMTPLSWRQ